MEGALPPGHMVNGLGKQQNRLSGRCPDHARCTVPVWCSVIRTLEPRVVPFGDYVELLIERERLIERAARAEAANSQEQPE